MRTSEFLCLLALSTFALTTLAQQTPAPYQDTPYTVVEAGANHRVWQRTTYQTFPNGEVVPHLHRYVELGTGLNHLVNGQWVASDERITVLPTGGGGRNQRRASGLLSFRYLHRADQGHYTRRQAFEKQAAGDQLL